MSLMDWLPLALILSGPAALGKFKLGMKFDKIVRNKTHEHG